MFSITSRPQLVNSVLKAEYECRQTSHESSASDLARVCLFTQMFTEDLKHIKLFVHFHVPCLLSLKQQ